jgi:hypothetical protein
VAGGGVCVRAGGCSDAREWWSFRLVSLMELSGESWLGMVGNEKAQRDKRERGRSVWSTGMRGSFIGSP